MTPFNVLIKTHFKKNEIEVENEDPIDRIFELSRSQLKLAQVRNPI